MLPRAWVSIFEREKEREREIFEAWEAYSVDWLCFDGTVAAWDAFIVEQISYSAMIQKCPEHMIPFGHVYNSSSKSNNNIWNAFQLF